MSLLLYALWKAPVIERVTVERSKRRCTTCGCGRATIKLRLPHVEHGRIYQYRWICDNCYKKYYPKSKEKFPDAIEIPSSRAAWNRRRAVIVAKIFPKRKKTTKDKTPDEIIRDIIDSQQDPAIVEKARYQCHMMNIVKILTKYGENDLAQLVQERLDSRSDPK